MEHEALRYSHEPFYGTRGGRVRYHTEADERASSHFVSPRETAYYHPDNYVFKRAPEAPYPYKASNEPARHDSHSYYRRSPYSHNPSHPFLAAGERDRKDVHHDSYPPVMNIPPRPILHEGLPGRMHLPAPRPAVYNRDQRGVPSHYYMREMRESPQTVMTHYGARDRQQDPPAQYKHSTESQTFLRTPQCAEREIEPSKSTDSASTVVSAPGTVDDRQKPQKQEETGGEDNNVLQTPKNNDEKNRLSDALLLASVASMARTEIDTSGPLPPQPSIERTVSIEAKGSDRTDTPSPANVQDCKAVTPSLSTKFVQDVLLSSRSTKEDDISKEIKIKLSQVSDESTAATSSEPGLDSSPDRSQAQAPVLPRHPLSYSETAGQERKHSGPPPLPGQDALPRRRSKVEEQAGPAIPNDIEPPRQNPPHYPQDAYRRSYGHLPAGHVHEMHQDYYHMSHGHYEEEGRYSRYPSFQPMHHYHMPGYPRDEQTPYHPGAQYHRSPYYHGMPPQHYADRRGMERPELRQEHYPAHDDYRPPLQYNKGHQPPNQGQAPPPNGKIILRRKCAWKNYPELEQFLIDNREEYLRHSAMNYTQEQKQYNNDLTERLLEVATKHNYEFDRNDFNFVAIRDRIRCYYKSYVQNCKKRGITVGYSHKNAKKRKASEDDGSVKKEDDETPSVKDDEPEVKKVKTEEDSVECNVEKKKKTEEESIETGDKQAHTNGPDGKGDEGATASEKRTEIVAE